MNFSDIPTFSIFSAASEIVVTVIVLYTIIGNLRGKPLQWKLLGGCLIFELCVNVMYMINRAASHDAGETPQVLKIMYAVHGSLSLIMFVGLVLLYLVSTFDQKAGHPTWFQRHARGTWAFVALWLISVGSGEAIFVQRYLLA